MPGTRVPGTRPELGTRMFPTTGFCPFPTTGLNRFPTTGFAVQIVVPQVIPFSETLMAIFAFDRVLWNCDSGGVTVQTVIFQMFTFTK